MKIDAINVEDKAIQQFLFNTGTVWIFNPPHASHMGGVWERMIGVARRILDSLLSDVRMKDLTHEVLTTFMAEVSAIVNARPIDPVSTDSENPAIITPSVLLTQKLGQDVSPLGDLDIKDMYKYQWKFVQLLADRFWNRWRSEYVQNLQPRRKWQFDCVNLKQGDVVLLRDKDMPRNDWSTGVVINAIWSQDGKVRKLQVLVMWDGKPVVYTRPILGPVYRPLRPNSGAQKRKCIKKNKKN